MLARVDAVRSNLREFSEKIGPLPALRRAALVALCLGPLLGTVGALPMAHAEQPARASGGRQATAGSRYVATTPEGTIDLAVARALASPTDGTALGALALVRELAPRAPHGKAASAVQALASAIAISPEVRGEAALVAQALGSDAGTPQGLERARDLGVVSDLSIVGPFRDTGGGLDAREGPEGESPEPAASFTDPTRPYSWGTVEAAWRPVPAAFADGKGVPLDVFIHPRRESCTVVATKLRLDTARTLIVRLASSGQARLMFDGTLAGTSDAVHELATFDRLAAKVEASAGPHLLYAKVCSGALEDAGRIRLRITDDRHAPLRVAAIPSLTLDPGEAVAWGRAKITKLTTPLERATANVKGEALLDAAIVRVLAGADDLRSPRAPGLLDALLQDPKLDANRTAMAAWVTSSGANKSGRMYLAHNRAQGSGDAETRGFVERALVRLRLDTDMPDWALATLRGAKIDQAADPDALLLHARTLAALGPDALKIEALHRLAAPFSKAPHAVPDGLVSELASLAQSYDARLWVEAVTELGQRGQRGEVLTSAMSARGKAAVAKAAGDAFAGNLETADEALAVAQAVEEAGADDLAPRLYAELVRWSPNRAEAWAGLARTLGGMPNSPDASRGIVLALQRARQLAPGEASYRAEIALRQAAKPSAQSANDDERWLTPIQTILARRQGVPTGSGAPDVEDRQLHWLRVVRMHPDHRVSQLIQYAREIVIAPRTQQELYEPIPPEGDLTEILRARVHKKDGGVAFPVEEHNDGTRPSIRWPELVPGDTVEVVLRQWTSTAVGGRGDAPFYFLDYGGSPSSHPLLYNEVVVDSLPDRPLYVDILHPELAPFKKVERDENGRHIVQFVWEKPLSIAEEPLAPELTETSPVIVGSTFQSWTDFRRWYQEAVRGFTEPDEEVRRLARELTRGKATRDDKVRALFNFVADDIRYVNYVSGEWWLPNRPQELLARREGDCDDKAILLIALLRAIGVEAEEVMVQTRLTGQPQVLLAKNAAVPMFDHGIAFLPGPGGGTYLDATSPGSRMGPIPSMVARALALRLDGPAEIVKLPASSPSEHGAEVTWTVTLDVDGGGSLTGTERHFGDSAFWLRTNLAEADARAQYVEDTLVGPWFPTSEVGREIAFTGDAGRGQAIVKYTAKSGGFARREGQELVVSISPTNTFGGTLAPLVSRSLPVQLPSYLAPSHQRRTVRIVAPAGYAWSDLPPGGEAAGPRGTTFGRAHLTLTRDAKDPRVLVIDREVVFDQDRVSPDVYPEWRAWLQRVDALMHKEVRLVPVGGVK